MSGQAVPDSIRGMELAGWGRGVCAVYLPGWTWSHLDAAGIEIFLVIRIWTDSRKAFLAGEHQQGP